MLYYCVAVMPFMHYLWELVPVQGYRIIRAKNVIHVIWVSSPIFAPILSIFNKSTVLLLTE